MNRSIAVPGFVPALSLTLLYLGLIVLIPLSMIFVKAFSGGAFWSTILDPRVLASLRLSFGAALVSATIVSALGFLVAWVLVRYTFPGRAVADALVDLPFALPTAVAGITLTAAYSKAGVFGSILPVAYTPIGIGIAMAFVGLPFTVRAVQPVLRELQPDLEEAAATLGARRSQIFFRIILPALRPAILTGFALAFARGLGEYGSVVFIAGNLPMKTEIAPLLIMTKLEQFDTAGASSIAVVMLVASLALLAVIHRLGGRR